MRRLKAARLRFTRSGEYFPNTVVTLDVRHGIRTRRASGPRLVHQDHLVDIQTGVDLRKGSNVTCPFSSLFLEARVDAVVNQGRLAGTADAGDTAQPV